MQKRFDEILEEAVALNKRKNELCDEIIKKIGKPASKYSPNFGITSVAKTFLLCGYKLSGQIIDAVRIGHVLIGLLGLRPLFELMINARYGFSHPRHLKSKRHMQRVAKDIIKVSNRKRPTKHSTIDGKNLYKRVEELKLMFLYRTIYRELSGWTHIGIRVPYLSEQGKGQQIGINVASLALCLVHDLMDGICLGFGFQMDEQWNKDVLTFRDTYQKYV